VPKQVAREECVQVPRQACTPVAREACQSVPKQQCTSVPKQVRITINVLSILPFYHFLPSVFNHLNDVQYLKMTLEQYNKP
jgi:hypothetical protein